MTTIRTYVGLNSLVLGAIGVSAMATVVLIALPGNFVAWQIGSWTLVFALLGLLALVLASAYSLVTNPASRSRRRIVCFLLGLSCLVVIAIGAL
jgi:uncharacterized membrane protein SirB2